MQHLVLCFHGLRNSIRCISFLSNTRKGDSCIRSKSHFFWLFKIPRSLRRGSFFTAMLMLSLNQIKLVNLDVDWLNFNIQCLTDPKTISSNLSKYFIPHVLMDDVPSIGFHGLKKSIRFLSVNIQNLKVTRLGLRLFSLVKMRLICY